MTSILPKNIFRLFFHRWTVLFLDFSFVLLFFLAAGHYRLWVQPNLQLPQVSGITPEPEDTLNSESHLPGVETFYISDGRIVLNVFEGDNTDSVVNRLSPCLLSQKRFLKAVRKGNLSGKLHSGHYVLTPGLGNRSLLRILKQGLQTPVRIRFSVVRTPEQLAGILSRQIMADSTALITAFRDTARLHALHLNLQTLPALFLPDTYEVWWNWSPDRLMDYFERTYRQFWTPERIAKVEANRLTPVEAATLASIVQDESNRQDEWPVIAGLYLNRLRKRIPLQACPTIKYVINDFTIRRVLKEYTEVESPYNTYLHQGLPPGPIGIATKEALLAVIDAVPNKYLYMCAKDDFSGRHYFSTSLTQHNIYATRYHAALTRRRIWH